MAPISRRTLLNRGLLVLAAAGGATLGVTKAVHHKIAVPPPAPPQALVSLLAGQQHLIKGYDATLASQPSNGTVLAALKSDLSAHSDAVRAVLESYPGWRYAQGIPPTPARSSPAGSVPRTTAALATETRQLATVTSSACTRWPAAETNAAQVVPLLGSITACLGTHLMVLS
jgi:hypothetical protein